MQRHAWHPTSDKGYRIQAAPSSAKAMKALRLLKDANAIPAFEMAALRSPVTSKMRQPRRRRSCAPTRT